MQKMILLIALFGVQIAFSQVPDWHWARSMGIHYNSVKQFTAVDPNGNSIVITDFISIKYCKCFNCGGYFGF